MRRALLALAAFVAVLAPAAPAHAHAQLVSADPAQDAALTRIPAVVTLTFSEQLNPDYTTIVVSDAAARRVPAAAPVTAATAGRLTLTGPLTNGVHTVAYRVVSVDGHTVQGSYPFTLADPALPPAAVPAAAPPAGSVGLPPAAVIGLSALGLVVPVAALLVYASRRRTTGGSRKSGAVPAP